MPLAGGEALDVTRTMSRVCRVSRKGAVSSLENNRVVVDDERDLQHIGSFWRRDAATCSHWQADWPIFPAKRVR